MAERASLAIYPDMDEEEHGILNVGFSLFQLVYPKLLNFEKKIFGYFDLKVDTSDPDPRSQSRQAKWITSGAAGISFRLKNKRGLASAWMPDDPWFHNRICLMDNGDDLKMVKQMRTPSGDILKGSEVMFEIRAMETILKDVVPSFVVLQNHKAICDFPTKEKAADYIDDLGRTEVKVGKDGTLKPQKISRYDYEIKEDTQLIWKPEILSLITENSNRYEHGWTECEEFMKEWKPQIVAKINENKERFKEDDKQASVKDVAQILKDLPQEVIDVIAERAAFKNAEKTEPVEAESVEINKTEPAKKTRRKRKPKEEVTA